MEPQTPKGWNVAGSDERVILFDYLLWILIPAYQNKMDASSDRIEGKLIRIPRGFDLHPMRVPEIQQMIQPSYSFPGQVNRMMPVSLVAFGNVSLIDLPRLIAVPNSPFPVSDIKPPLKSLPQPPFDRLIYHHKSIEQMLESNLIDGHEQRRVLHPPNFYEVGGIERDGELAIREIGVLLMCHFGRVLHVAINVEGRCFLVVELSANVETKHIALFTGYRQDKTVAPLLDQEHLLGVAVQDAGQFQLAQAQREGQEEKDDGFEGIGLEGKDGVWNGHYHYYQIQLFDQHHTW